MIDYLKLLPIFLQKNKVSISYLNSMIVLLFFTCNLYSSVQPAPFARGNENKTFIVNQIAVKYINH